MGGSSARDLWAILGLLERVGAADSRDDYAAALTDGIRDVVACDISSYNEIDPPASNARHLTTPGDAAFAGSEEALAAHMDEHPLIGHFNETGDGRAAQISDFVSNRRFLASGLYRDLFAPVGVRSVMSITISGTGRSPFVALALLRNGGGFSERDRTVLDALRPHLGHWYGKIDARETLANITSGLGAFGREVVVVDRNGRIITASETARALLNRFFLPWDDALALPPRLLAWLRASRAVEREGESIQAVMNAGPGELLVQCSIDGDRIVLFLEERDEVTDETAAEVGLTPREREVLRWTIRGRSNPQIGEVLGISPRTVKKHLGSIYGKLGVSGRTEAAAVASRLSGTFPASRTRTP